MSETGYGLSTTGVRSQRRQDRHRIQSGQAIYPGVKLPKLQAHCSHPFRAEVKNTWSPWPTSRPHTLDTGDTLISGIDSVRAEMTYYTLSWRFIFDAELVFGCRFHLEVGAL